MAVKWTETVSRQAYAVRPPVYSIVYDEKLATSLTPVNPVVRGRILSSNLEDVRINQEGVDDPVNLQGSDLNATLRIM